MEQATNQVKQTMDLEKTLGRSSKKEVLATVLDPLRVGREAIVVRPVKFCEALREKF